MTAICEQPMIKISGIKIAEGIDAPSYPFPDKINMISWEKKIPIITIGIENANRALNDLFMSSRKFRVSPFDSIALERGIATVVHAVYNDIVRMMSFEAVVK